MYQKKHKIQQRQDSDNSDDSIESSVYRIKNREEMDKPRQYIQQSEPQQAKKYVIINREGDEEEDDLGQQSDIFLPEVRTQEEINISQSYIQQKSQQDQQRQLKCNEVQESKQQIKQNHNRYITRKQIIEVLDTEDEVQIVAELEKINQWGLLSKSIDNIDIKYFKDMTDKFLQIFYILMEEPHNKYIFYIEEIFKSKQMLAQLKKLLESKKDKDLLYQQFFQSTLGFLKISSNINIIPIDEVIAQYKIDKSLGKIDRRQNYDNQIANIREIHTEKIDQENREKQIKEVQKQRSEWLQQMQGIRIDYKECPSEPTELDFQFHNNEPKPPFGQLFPVVQEGGYLSNELFVNNHFYILREDYLQLFRKALWHLKQQGFYYGVQEVIQDAYVYENIILQSMSIDRIGLQVELEISPYQIAGRQPQKINWNITKRLMSGSLVMFTDEEQSVKNIFFTVIKKQTDRENSPTVKVQLKLINGLLSSLIELISLLKSGKYVYLIENKVFYDPYIHFLNCLKQMDVNKIPFKDIIIAQKQIDVMPLYVQKAYDRNYAIDYNICLKMNLNTQNLNYSGKRIHLYDPWPTYMYESLDKSQVEAIQLMLRQGIGIVQGPPGTGKTFCGALAVRILQNNRNFIDRGLQKMEDNRPILIVCYTNHALDQFLKHILAFTDKSKIVRIGGRCQDEEIQDLLLQKQEKSNPHFPFKDFYQNRDYLQKQFLNQTKSNEIEFRITKQNYKKDIISICKGFLQLQSVKFQNFYLSDLTQEYIFNLWLNYDYKDLKLIHYLIVEQLEAKVDNKIISINNRGYQKNNYQHYSIGILDEKLTNQQQSQLLRQQNNRLDQDEEDDVQLNSDEEEDRQLYQQYDDEPDIQPQQDISRRNYTRESNYQRQNNKRVFDEMESKLNIQPQSQKYQYNINPRKLSDVWNDKIELLHKFYKLKFEQLGQEFQAEFDAFMAESRQLSDLYMEQDLKIIQQKQIVGLTVTGCAKYAKHLDKLKFGIMIIEEAAEVLESHTIAILSKNVEHLILIGDHQQLKPKLENYMIEKKYKTNISLFERLINNGINFVTLSNQRRMRTDFANIIRLIYGNEYQDHPQIQQQNLVQIKGLKHHLVFFDHQNNEKNHLDFQSSKCNEFESGMITNLVRYLIANEYAPTQITVLSMYIKQVQDIKKQFIKERITGVKIQTVDNYQGEENDIIILSLVRSNNKMQLGFVGIDNRVCVALSRARLGLYVFGDFQFIKNSVEKSITKNRNNSDLWIRIINHMKQTKNLMEQLVLQCQSHKTETIIKQLQEWRNSVHGGCQLVCNIRFDCGHVCKLKCHQLSHTKKNCPEICDTKLQCGHKCTSYCRVIPCPPCKTIVQKYLRECNHFQNAECHQKEDEIFCKSQCKRFLSCRHPCPLLCGNDCSDAQCMVQINVRLDCNHIKTINCVDKTNPKRCLCDEIINKQLQCGHIKQIKCQDRSLEQQCEDQCKRKLQCGHSCKQKCYQNCQMFHCKEKVSLTRGCGHQIQAECFNKNQELAQSCSVNVVKTLDCGHTKQIKCHQLKDKIICYEPIKIKTGFCQHNFTTTCNKRNDSLDDYECDEPCQEILSCGHQCLQICQRCINNDFHDICKQTLQHPIYGQYGCMSEIEQQSEPLENVLEDLKKLKKSPLYKLIKEQDTAYFEPHQVEVARFQIKFGQQFIDLQDEFSELDDIYYHILELVNLPNLFQLLSKKLYMEFKQKFCYAICLAFDVIEEVDQIYQYQDIKNDQIGRILKLLKGQKTCLQNLTCGHRCKLEFHLNLDYCFCEKQFIKKLDCGHDKTYQCQEVDFICLEKCNKQLNCGHQCEENCHQGNCKCNKQKNHLLKCHNHQMMIECEKLAQLQHQLECDQFCKFKLPCGHLCNSKCGECFDNIHNLCQTKILGKYGQNVYCGQEIQNRSQIFFFQNKPDINNILKPLKSNYNQQIQKFYYNLLDKNIAFNLTSTQSIILQKQIDLMIKFIELNQNPVQQNTYKINILNNILFRDDLYLRANQVYMDQLSQAMDQLQKPQIRKIRQAVQW